MHPTGCKFGRLERNSFPSWMMPLPPGDRTFWDERGDQTAMGPSSTPHSRWEYTGGHRLSYYGILIKLPRPHSGSGAVDATVKALRWQATIIHDRNLIYREAMDPVTSRHSKKRWAVCERAICCPWPYSC